MGMTSFDKWFIRNIDILIGIGLLFILNNKGVLDTTLILVIIASVWIKKAMQWMRRVILKSNLHIAMVKLKMHWMRTTQKNIDDDNVIIELEKEVDIDNLA